MVLLKYTALQNIFWDFCHNCRKRFLGTSANFSTILGHNDEEREYLSTGKKITVAVEGNIGSGKSTLLEYFRTCPLVEKLLYEDPSRWCFLFNNYVMLSRLEIHSYRQTTPVKLMERSLHSTRHIFIENSYRSGSLTDLEYSVLEAWFENLLAQPCTHVDLFGKNWFSRS
ncbi:hypothetical protein LSH36_891g02027 [Paralvinella palmiformis]|uniref:Deoxynucleoside kinase domain-containing protein n=1 Tax=Paralvinella palmiformis TaxID=53620 RepID=A0AAD9IYL1_9ANNE|nr:hypothetical protein LSH36_891g02027 [Paralvinella palmiformis]